MEDSLLLSFIVALRPAPVPQFRVMRLRNAIAVGLGVVLIGICGALIWPRSVRKPPVVSFVNMEPAGIFDDDGREMSWVTLKLTNFDSRPSDPENFLNIKNGDRGINAKVADRWVHVDGLLDCGLYPGQSAERLFLMPWGTKGCRASLKYTGSRLTRGRLWMLAGHLPRSFRYRMSQGFWRWIGSFGMPGYGPRGYWQGAKEELMFSPPFPQSASNSAEAHNPLMLVTPVCAQIPFLRQSPGAPEPER